MKIFALTADKKVLRIKTKDTNLESNVVKLFKDCYGDYENPENIIEFSAGNRNGATRDDVFVIDNFCDSDFFHKATKSASNCGVYDQKTTPLDSIIALFVKPDIDSDKLLFQYFDNPKRLSNERFVLFSYSVYNEEFTKLEGAGFILDSKLVAVLDESKLYFKSFFYAKRVFELGNYFRAATDEELEKFNHHPMLNPIDDDLLKKITTNQMREKIFEIDKSGILNSINVSKFVSYAKIVDLNIEVHDNKITMPSSKDSLKQFLSLLCEDYYNGVLRNQTYLSIGKRSAR